MLVRVLVPTLNATKKSAHRFLLLSMGTLTRFRTARSECHLL